jgi:hypothetical protein
LIASEGGLSGSAGRGIPADVSRFLRPLTLFLLIAATGCDLRTLQEAELTDRPDAASPDTGPDIARTDGDSDRGELIVDSNPPDAVIGCPAIPCEAFETCEPATGMCKLRTGPGMLSGSVLDACTRHAVNARIGVAGRRQCSINGKGSYFFSSLPEGTLALIAFKDGYKHFEVPVVITASGTVQDILLQPDTPQGCAEPLPPDVACVCDMPGCP